MQIPGRPRFGNVTVDRIPEKDQQKNVKFIYFLKKNYPLIALFFACFFNRLKYVMKFENLIRCQYSLPGAENNLPRRISQMVDRGFQSALQKTTKFYPYFTIGQTGRFGN